MREVALFDPRMGRLSLLATAGQESIKTNKPTYQGYPALTF